MKKVILVFSMILSANALAAGTEIFTGRANYSKPGWDSKYNQLEQAGVERAAERKAVGLCYASGATDCVILNDAIVTKCNVAGDGMVSSICEAEAHVRGVVLE